MGRRNVNLITILVHRKKHDVQLLEQEESSDTYAMVDVHRSMQAIPEAAVNTNGRHNLLALSLVKKP